MTPALRVVGLGSGGWGLGGCGRGGEGRARDTQSHTSCVIFREGESFIPASVNGSTDSGLHAALWAKRFIH